MFHRFISLRDWVVRLTGVSATERPAPAPEPAAAARPAAMKIVVLEERAAPGIIWGD